MREAEERLFAAGVESWWNAESGPFRLLHAVNPLRLRFAEEAAGGAGGVGGVEGVGGLSGKRLMDLGCGGGIFSEAAAKNGALVSGVDVSANAIAAAQAHADESGLEIEYAASDSASAARNNAGRFDIVSCFEMLEHVENPASVVADAAALLAPGGCAVFSTVSRTLKARVLMIGLLEQAMKILPDGAHDWRMFIRPAELAGMCRDSGLQVRDIAGLRYSLRARGFVLDRADVSANYFLAAVRKD